MKRSSKWPLVSLIVLNWNGEKIIKNCLDSLIKNTDYPNYTLTVVDNGSTDKSREILEKFFKKKVDLIFNKENLGFSKGMNVGIRYVLKKYNPEYIGLLNNDLLFPDKDWLKKIIAVMEKDKTIGVASPMCIFPDGRIQRVGEKLGNNLVSIMIKVLTALPEKKYRKKPRGVKEVDVFLGACFIIRGKTIRSAGLLDERYSPFLIEEIEYSFRIKKYGYRSFTVCSSKVVHLLSHSIKKLTKESAEKDLFKVYVATRNAFLFSLEYFGILRSFLFSLPVIVFTSFFERREKEKGLNLKNIALRKYPKKRICYLIKAVIDALRLMKTKKLFSNIKI